MSDLNGNELISPCSCEKKYHKKCVLLTVLYSNNIFCESCLDIFTIKSTNRVGFWSYIFSKRNYHSFIIQSILIVLTALALYLVADYKLQNSELYYQMKIFFIVLLVFINTVSVIVFLINCVKVYKNKPPLIISIESQEKNLNQSSISNIYNIIAENQNSNQNLISNNVNNLNTLNRLNKNNKNNPQSKQKINNHTIDRRKSGMLNSQFISTKNFVDYNEFFFNVSAIEIFEAKLNLINRNKFLHKRRIEEFETIKELNDDKFQQNILIKCMDFNSDSESFEFNNNEIRRSSYRLNNNNHNNRYNNKITNNINLKNNKTNRRISLEIPISQEDIENDSENELYYKKLNGMFPDSPLNSNAVGFYNNFRKIFSVEGENSENKNTNINSVSLQKNSQKDLTGLNMSNSNHENKEINYLNINEEKLILKENYLNQTQRKLSNSKLVRKQTYSVKMKSKASFKDFNSNDSMGSYGINKYENNQGINYRDFIVTEEKDFMNHSNNNYKIPNQKQSNETLKFKRKDSKIPSAVFGDFKSFRGKSSANIIETNKIKYDNTNDLSNKINMNTNMNIFSNPDPKVPTRGKISRRYSSFSPLITKMFKNNNNNSTNTDSVYDQKKDLLLVNNKGSFGMNIFSNNLGENKSVERTLMRKSNKNNYDESDASIYKKINNNTISNSILRNNKCSPTKSVIYNKNSKSKFNFNNEEFMLHERNKTDSLNNYLDNSSNLSFFKNKLLTISPRKNKYSSRDLKENIHNKNIKQSLNLQLNSDYNESMNKKLEKLRNNHFSNSIVGIKILNKIDLDLVEDKIFLNEKENILINNNNSNINTNKGKEEKLLIRKTSLLKVSELRTINEECEINIKNFKNAKEIINYESDFIDENKEKFEKNKSINSSDLNKFIDYPKDLSRSSLFINNPNNFNNFNNSNKNSNIKQKEFGNEKTNKDSKNNFTDNKDINVITEGHSDSDSLISESSSEDEDSLKSKSDKRSDNYDLKNDDTINREIGKELKTETRYIDDEFLNQQTNEVDKIINNTKRIVIETNQKKKNSVVEESNYNISNPIDEAPNHDNHNLENNEKELEIIDISDINCKDNFNIESNIYEGNYINSGSLPINNYTTEKVNSSTMNAILNKINTEDFNRKDNDNSDNINSKYKVTDKFSKFNDDKQKDKNHNIIKKNDIKDRDELNIENLILVNSSDDESDDSNY